jgi:hypothetical protein
MIQQDKGEMGRGVVMFFSRRPVFNADVGDRFEKQRHPPTIWRVDAVIDRPAHPPHVRLVDDTHRQEATVALSVLAGPEYRAVVGDRPR